MHGLTHTGADLITREQTIARTSPGGTLNLPVYWVGPVMVEDLRATNKIVIPWFPVIPNPDLLLSQVHEIRKWFTVEGLCSVLFSIPVDPSSQYLPLLRTINNIPALRSCLKGHAPLRSVLIPLKYFPER